MTYVVGNATHLRGRALSGEPQPGGVYRYDGSAFVCDDILNECEEEIARNRRNIQLLFLQQATYQHIALGEAVNGFYDSFEDERGVKMDSVVGEYDADKGCFVSAPDPGPCASPYFTDAHVDRRDRKGLAVSWRQDQAAAGHFEGQARGFDVSAAVTSEDGGAKTGFPAAGHGLAAGATVRFEGFSTPAFNGVHTVDASSAANKIVIAVPYSAEVISGACTWRKALSLGPGGDCPEIAAGMVVGMDGLPDSYIASIDPVTGGAGLGKVILSAAKPSGPISGVYDTRAYHGRIMPAFRCQDAFSVSNRPTPGTRPSPRQLHCEIVHCPTRKYYAIGGARFDTGLYVNECWEYDIDADAWRLVNLSGDPAGYSRHHSVAYVPRVGKYLIMGCDLTETGAWNSLHIWMAWFDPAALSWTNIIPNNYPTIYQRSSGAYDPVSHCFWLFGGDTTAGQGASVSNELWRYDIAANAWTRKGLSGGPDPRARMSVIYEHSHALLMYGGVDASGAFRSDLWRYDIAADAWEQLSPAGTAPALANQKHCYEPANGRWYHWGGMSNASTFNPYVYVYDVPTNSWSQAAYAEPLLYGSHCSRSAIAILDAAMYCFGGSMPTPYDNAVRVVQLYQPLACASPTVALANGLSGVDASQCAAAAAASVSDRVPDGARALYALSWDDGASWAVHRNGQQRDIVRQENGVWQARGPEGWAPAAQDTAFAALAQAAAWPENQMTAQDMTAIPPEAWDEAAVTRMPCRTLRVAMILVSAAAGVPEVAGWVFNRSGGLDVQSVAVPMQDGTSRVSPAFLVKRGADSFRYYLASDSSNPVWVALPEVTKAAAMGGGVEYWTSDAIPTPGGDHSLLLRVRAGAGSEVHGWAASWNG
ncbi:MAG: Kelch repeat-containing protein [Desulfomonilaceae bacterium]